MQPEPRRKSARNQKPDPPPEPTPPKQAPNKDKRKHTPAKEKTVQPAKSATPAPPPLPTKLGPGHPIPELKEPQPPDLPDSEWQTVTESGVLKAAIERSRQKWMTPGIFELYYSKAGKKRLPGHKEREKEKEKDKDKGENEADEKDSVKAKQMKREGNCKLYIDPHQWDITIWTMRENTVPPPPKPKPPVHQPVTYGNHGQYHGGYAASHPYRYQSPTAAPKHPPPPPKQTPSRPPQPPQPPPPARPTRTRPPAAEVNTPAPKPAPDPVIHMLAERANTNYKLRDVMKIVARGDATKEQLEYFQGHITELNERLEAQKKAQAQAQAQKAQPPPPAARPPVPAHIASVTPPATPAQQTPVPPRTGNGPPQGTPSIASTSTPTPAKPTPSSSAPSNMPQQPPMTFYTPPPQPSPFGHYPPPQPTSAVTAPTKSPAPPPPQHHQQQQQQQQHQRPPQPHQHPHPAPPPQPVQPPPPPQITYRALCIDFNTNGDRLLFPRETILEALPGNQVLASFLKVQKIDLAAMNTLARSNSYYQALKEYYQPITVRFRAADSNPAVLGCLWRWVKPADEVRKYMDDVMDRCLPADVVEIAARLPREGTKAALGERDPSAGTPRESVERVGTPEGRERKRVKRR
ncbi:hypothetical protein IWX90DRAFT_484659 [Phyllosticta citrichinensis]|uniref:SWR1-complex protein 3 domain-containing protein n=1 Tax=Phyllosticta citrichinensis TaxID=1130410 RepID=A0ABR1XZX3_9PEZI